MANLLSDTINYIRPFCRYQEANIGTNNMPIIGIANIVRNVILAAPMRWNFNRSENSSYTLSTGVQDYTLAISDFGYLERASVKDPDDGKFYEIPDVLNNASLARSSLPTGRPQTVSIHNISGPILRFSAVPNKNYSLYLVYQKVASQFVAISDQWSPIPDTLSDVYNNLCLGYYMDSCQDPRAPQYISKGIASLLARQSGLSEMDKAIFAQSYMNLNSAFITQGLETQQGRQAQAVR
ncbi:MAG TPA: hypothetical protein VFA52_04610 [Candidatus Paceibacterota bacterium]|nr:hypothetical protein [Candidatus Paceibacterota bacterium]